MEVARLKAERRTALGRNQVAQLRKQGWLPAVVYGEGGEPQSIAISEWELEQHVKAHHKVFHLEVDGKRQDAYLQEIQWHAISDRPSHADFRRIDLTKPIELEVEVAFLGHPVGIGKGGVLIKDHPKLMVRCLPTAIPENLPASIAALDMDEGLLAKDVKLPEGVLLAVSPETVVCHVAKLVIVVETPATPAALPEGAEGAVPAAGAPATGAGAPAAAGGKTPAAPAKEGKDQKPAGDKPGKG
ncbi:MAG TPA: 50S ribosomal protein L25 [Planctomycetota bacterium]|nr:50S ribosomal protein L25 [Planctomycetota bacterium]